MEVTYDKPDLVLCLAERTLLRWQMRGLDSQRKDCRGVAACWQAAQIKWEALEGACRHFVHAENYEIITPLHRYSKASLKLGFKPRKARKLAEDARSQYMSCMKTFRLLFQVRRNINWKMGELKKQLICCQNTIVKLKEKRSLPVDVEAADVNLILGPEGVRSNRIEMVFAKGIETVAIVTVPRNELLRRLKFGKTLRMWKRMNVVKLIRCDVRCTDPQYCSIETQEQFDKLITDLNGQNHQTDPGERCGNNVKTDAL